MAVNFLNDISKYEFSGFPIGFSRNNPIPLDKTEVWLDLEELKTYAASGATAYVGQKLTHVDVVNKTATVYTIADEAGNLQAVGAPTEGDEVTIALDNGILSLKDFGKRYYEFVAATEATEEAEAVPAHYELVEVDDTHPWSAGLTPKVVEENGVLVLGWFEPNETTIEGVQEQANTALDTANKAQEEVDAVEEKVTEVETKVTEVETKVDEITNTLNDTTDENGEVVEGLITRTENLEADVADLQDAVDNTYTKEEVDGKIASVFHYKGKKETYADLLLITDMIVGDVWEVVADNKEYAYNGSEWIELGFTVDLSAYATTEYVDSKAKSEAENAAAEVQTNVDNLSETVDNLSSEVETLTAEGGTIAALEDRVVSAESDIQTLTNDTENLAERTGTLESYVGTPSESSALGALYPAVESINQRLNKIVADGGEPNLLNGISVNGTALSPNDALIIDLPIFNGSTFGFVPAANDFNENYFLNATGEWTVPMDSRIGTLTFDSVQYSTVEEYVDAKVEAALTWENIAE